MGWKSISDEQWAKIREHVPVRAKRPKGGRPAADDRKCFEGILWIAWTGSPWAALPKEYGSASTCWRRLNEWEAGDVFLNMWRALLAELNNADKLEWDECFADGSFAPAKKGQKSRQNQARQGNKVDGGGRWRGYSAGSTLGLGIAVGSEAA